ncbi:MAG: hypothetical protein OZ921_14630, partial [Sorangiineae bacterium]|nr:hypothetical protein [Sorangiineae bacterium]
ARTGQTVFGGSLIWMGRGETNYPARWETSALGHDCEKVPDRPARGFDLRDGSPLGQAEVDAALEVVWRTAVPAALYQWGYVFDSVVLLYPRTVGAFDPTSAEYVVIVNSGFLE